jgi:hypothetical protein
MSLPIPLKPSNAVVVTWPHSPWIALGLPQPVFSTSMPAGAVQSIICRPNSASGIHRNTFPIGCTTRHTAAISKKPLSLCDWYCNSNKYHACRNDGCGKNEICRLLNRYGIELGQCGPKCQPAESRRLSSVSPCGLSVASPGASFHGLGASGRTFSPQ